MMEPHLSNWMITTASLLLAYLIGSVPTAIWVGQVFFGKDIRNYGSGNAGATNTFRVLGTLPGVLVLLVDITKGWLAMELVSQLSPWVDAGQTSTVLVFAALCATLGHIFPVLAGFRGGKGIATMLGIVIYLYPHAFIAVVVLFLLVFLSTGMVSLGSILAALSFPFITWFGFGVREAPLIILALAIAVVVPLTHRRNIGRLIRGEENRLHVFRRRKQNDDE